VLLIASSSE